MGISINPIVEKSQANLELAKFYEAVTEFIRSKDIEGLAGTLSDNFVGNPPSGDQGSRSVWLNSVQEEFQRWDYQDVHFTIEKLHITDNIAIAYMTKRLVTTTSHSATTQHHYLTTALTRETLERAEEGWQIKESEGITRQVLIDGSMPALEELKQIAAIMQTCTNPYPAS
jgi:hypothetical protein